MTSKTPAAPRTLDELRQAIFHGEIVTAEEYAKAATLAELDELQREADRQAEARRVEAERLTAIGDVKQTVLTAIDADAEQADLRALTDAAARIIARHNRRAQGVRDAMRALAQLGLRAGETTGGIAWKQAAMGTTDAVVIDGIAHSAVASPGRPIAFALQDAATATGRRGALTPHVQLAAGRRP